MVDGEFYRILKESAYVEIAKKKFDKYIEDCREAIIKAADEYRKLFKEEEAVQAFVIFRSMEGM